MASFKDILAERRKSGAGLGSSLKTALSERAKEKLDPRNYLFAKGGMATALFPKLAGYKAKIGTEKIKRSVGSDNINLEPVIVKLDELNMQFKIVTKNSMSLPGMARDMNIMRQNIVKLVSKMKVKPASSADAFFMDASRKESAYEQMFGRKATSPTAVGKDKGKDGEGFFAKLLTGGFSGFLQDVISNLLKGGLLTALAVGIGKYINDPEFRKSINDTVNNLMTSVFGADWAENLKAGLLALGAGLLVANNGLGLIGGTLSIVNNGLGLLEKLFRGLVYVGGLLMTGFKNVIKFVRALGSGIAYVLALIPGNFFQETKEDDLMAAKRAEMGVKDTQFSKEEAEKKQKAIAELKALEKSASESTSVSGGKVGPVHKNATQKRMDELKDIIDPSRKYSTGDNSPTQTSSNFGKMRIENYLGRKVSDTEYGMLIKAVYAESSRNKDEYTRVMAVILNRARKTGASIIDVLQEENQFQAVTGTSKNRNPSANFMRGPDSKSLNMILDSTDSLSKISQNLDSFSAADRKAYKEGTSTKWLDDLLKAGGTQVGGTVFAENMYRSKGMKRSPNQQQAQTGTGNMLNEMSTEFINGFRGGAGTTNVNNTTNNITKNDSGGGGAILAADGPYNSDLAKTFFGR